MPFVSTHTTDDEWRREAVRLADIIRKGPGSPHQRVATLHQALLNTAAENFNAGKLEGASASTPVEQMGETAHLREENEKLKKQIVAKSKPAAPVTDADLMEYMRLADDLKDNPEGVGEKQTVRIQGSGVIIAKLAMEVAKLRFQAKAAAK